MAKQVLGFSQLYASLLNPGIRAWSHEEESKIASGKSSIFDYNSDYFNPLNPERIEKFDQVKKSNCLSPRYLQ